MKARSLLHLLASVAVVVGRLTVFGGGSALFGDAQARASVGNAVGFVLWFNFLAGFGYVATGAGLWLRQRWATWAAAALALTTALVGLAFGIHVMNGGAYEMRTVAALGLRLGFWTVVAAVSFRIIDKSP